MQIWPNGLPRVQSELQRSSSIPCLFVKSFLCPSAFFTSSSDHSFVRQCYSSLRQIVPLFVSVLRLFLASVRSFSLLKTRSSTQSLKIRLSTSILLQPNRPPSTKSSSLAMRSSSGFVFLQVQQKSSFEDSFCFLELESYRLKIYVAKLVHNSSRTRVWKPWFFSWISSFQNSRC